MILIAIIIVPSRIECACPGDLLTFNCTVVGGTATIFRGTAFDCPNAGNQTILSHSQFNDLPSAMVLLCNNGLIMGQPLSVTGNCYISELNVTVSNEVHNKTVQCIYNSDVAVSVPVGIATITVILGKSIMVIIIHKIRN